MLIKFRYLNTVPVMTLVLILEILMILEKAASFYYGYSLLWFVSVFVGVTYLIRSEYSK